MDAKEAVLKRVSDITNQPLGCELPKLTHLRVAANGVGGARTRSPIRECTTVREFCSNDITTQCGQVKRRMWWRREGWEPYSTDEPGIMSEDFRADTTLLAMAEFRELVRRMVPCANSARLRPLQRR
ncbi:hypothetical protein [Nocardia yunnanensis]|uniref:hypothetical protein n=1 Tax=Nocardia yunnanensis TaxID=2382165 RepID=UPI0013C473ED|nr:hypothetical protein [Nocardia yunnanensis]